ncbi:hypothetical protein TrRE_jg2466 [Triparma retinervis]|uniref:Uncharacterized protein n=1 Tax=Triparma retinervis TaxID=2557542 RepID=A0A9W6ZHY0_9STRA|nr:hypothetical protein TrRE_jg2466 [Triparma retinervis]
MGKITSADVSGIIFTHCKGAGLCESDVCNVDNFVIDGSGENEFNVTDNGDVHYTAFGVDSLSDLIGKGIAICKKDVVFVDGLPDFDRAPKAGDALGPVFLCKGGGGFYLINIKTNIPQSISWARGEDWEEPIEARRC